MYFFDIIEARDKDMKMKIERLDDFGRGVTFLDGKICFVIGALPGEIADAEVIRETKKFYEAKVIKLLEKSPARRESHCPYYGICGGCQLDHTMFSLENEFKENKVKNLVRKFSHIDSFKVTNIVSSSPYEYRNKITLHGKNRKLGLYQNGTFEIVSAAECLLIPDRIREIIKLLEKVNQEITEAVIKTSNDLDEVLVKITGEVSEYQNLLSMVDVLIINNKVVSLKDKIKTHIGDKYFYHGADSFFQVNRTLTKELYDEALKIVSKIRPKTVLDLYCGTGTIGIYLSDYCDKIIGIDYNRSNISNAFLNKKLNHVENIDFICDKVENRIHEFQNIDLIVVDPPRSGLDQKTKKYLELICPQTIIYISCDPVTLVRDLNDLNDCFDVQFIKPVNMFPRTYHVECVCLLSKRIN